MQTQSANVQAEPARLPPPSSRRLLLGRNTELRRLLALGVVQALGVVDRRCATPAGLRQLVNLIDQLFSQHGAEEDAHARQRAELHALGAWPADGGDVELATRFDRLARELLRDIAREEHSFLIGGRLPQGPGKRASISVSVWAVSLTTRWKISGCLPK